MTSIQGIYMALFGRPADPNGLAFWNAETDGGRDLGPLIGRLTAAPEYLQRFEGMSDEEIVDAIYFVLFGRNAEPEGLAFFVGELRSGRQTVETIAINIFHGAQGADRDIVEKKLEAADLLTTLLDLPEEIAAYVGETAAQIGRDYLSGITDETTPEVMQQKAEEAVLRLLGLLDEPSPSDPPGPPAPADPPPTPDPVDPPDETPPPDNPAAISGEATGRVAEDGEDLAMGRLIVTDPDPGEAVVIAASPLDATYGTFTLDGASGAWTYTLDNDDEAVQALGEGETLEDRLDVASRDGTASTTIVVTIDGANDAPTLADGTLVADEDGFQVTLDLSSLAEDVDAVDDVSLLTYSILSAPEKGNASVGGSELSFEPGSGFQELGASDVDELVIEIEVEDGAGATARSNVLVTVRGQNDPASISGVDTGQVTVGGTETVSGSLEIIDRDFGQDRFVVESPLVATWGVFVFNETSGDWSYTLGGGKQEIEDLGQGDMASDTLHIESLDGDTPGEIVITIIGGANFQHVEIV
ncbi:VCBS domain-containing protein [Salinarimonas ramus]|uniref:Cadherin domain-containing protein n=1 Tax=Salinarimonas ramus TaxID=690164 RepID=A0A917V7J1_9HYPH|nr:VCBS domain-containing protein [Salinarimonas ramus]GGK49092.1 hypothetical protein GCM10011322_40110 [Salinarimonas ramus]